MKLLILFFISLSIFANYIPVELVGTDLTGKPIFTNSAKCKKHYAKDCIKLPSGFNPNYYTLQDVIKDDLENPIYTKTEVLNQCGEYCQSLWDSNTYTCQDQDASPYLNLDIEEIYCAKVTGYNQIATGQKIVAEDAVLKANYESQVQAKKDQEEAIQNELKAIEHGKRVIAVLMYRNRSKNLTTAQISQMNNTYSDIKNLLDTGSLETAKLAIGAITPDGTIVTEQDKTALIQEIDNFLN